MERGGEDESLEGWTHSILANPCCVETLLAVVAQAISDLDPLWGRR
jgi:hypothetical protein